MSLLTTPNTQEIGSSANAGCLISFVIGSLMLCLFGGSVLWLISPDLQQSANEVWFLEAQPTLSALLIPPTNTPKPTFTAIPTLTSTVTRTPSRTPITAAPTRTVTTAMSATPSFVGFSISVGGNFTDARYIGVDGSGRAYVGEYQPSKVLQLNALASIANTWSIDSTAPMTGLAVDKTGNVYVAQNRELTRYDATGRMLGKINYARGFYDVALLPDGGLAVAWYDASLNDYLLVFNAEGVLKLTIEKALSAVKGSAEILMRVATDKQGNMYVWGSNVGTMIVKYAPDGKRLATIGSAGSQAGQFSLLSAVAVDGKGRVFASDLKGIQVFEADGKYIDKFTLTRVTPNDMEFGDQNDLWIAARTSVVKVGIAK